ncbi:tetratricopeptide repeat protein 12 [Biomphalaria pfeifferi]|uniref:Protein unc-45 homolog B n=1 Tax=Biomphalaria pfeifferi TaxID=112525 RepID=A0AAD8BFD9_BIOPF|nr:tetratricopeptide repeat protein 12 [Biomphalaria pfeifferi]
MANLPKLPNQPSEKEIHNFLSKVDEIENVLKGLNSDNEEKRDFYMSKADEMIEKIQKEKKNPVDVNDKEEPDMPRTKTGFSKTSINKDCYKNDIESASILGPAITEPMDQNAFMAAMEADAKDRAERRKERETTANTLKEQGNAEFKQGNFQKALELYNQAIDQIRDSSVLYTNRAQARMKLGLYSDALKDCDLALRLWPNCLKAYIHQGHAYLALKDFDKARKSYQQILSVDPKKENMVQEYIADVNRAEEASQMEAKATKLFESGDEVASGVVDLLNRVNQKNQLPLYYSGGFRVLASVIKDADSQTLFRTHNGFQLLREHQLLSRCFSSPLNSLSKDEKDVMSAALEMFTSACKDNETNQQMLLSLPEFVHQISSILVFNFKGQERVLKIACLNLLHEISLTSAGRAAVVGKFDVDRLTAALFPLMMKATTYGSTAAAVLNNIALDRRLKSLLREKIEEKILPAFESLLVTTTPTSIVSLAASAVTNLVGDQVIRNKMASSEKLWDNTGHLLGCYKESKLIAPLEYLLGLLLNLSTNVPSASLERVGDGLIQNCYSIAASGDLSDLSASRALGVLSNLLPHCQNAVSYMCQDARTLLLLNLLKNQDPAFYKPALKCITAVTQSSEEARQLIAQNKGTSILMRFLAMEDEVVIGNAALCLSHLCQVKQVCSKLTKTNIIQKLLELARDGRKHLDRLRELHGIEILHGCMKHIK